MGEYNCDIYFEEDIKGPLSHALANAAAGASTTRAFCCHRIFGLIYFAIAGHGGGGGQAAHKHKIVAVDGEIKEEVLIQSPTHLPPQLRVRGEHVEQLSPNRAQLLPRVPPQSKEGQRGD